MSLLRSLARSTALPAALALISVGSASASTLIYSNDFESGAGSEWTDNTIATAFNSSTRFLGTDAYGSAASTNTLSLNALPSHTWASVTFDFYAINSWDGNSDLYGRPDAGPDFFSVIADSNSLLHATFTNWGFFGQSYPNAYGSAPDSPAQTGAFAVNTLGANFPGDATYRITLTFAHTAANLALDFIGGQNQNRWDEGWGLDNVSVTVGATPEPTTLALLGLAAAGTAVARRFRRA